MYKEITSKMDFNARTMMFGLRMYSENALLPGLLITKFGDPAPPEILSPHKYIDIGLKYGLLKMVDGIIMFVGWYKYFKNKPTIDSIEEFRKKNRIKKLDIIRFAGQYLNGYEPTLLQEIVRKYDMVKSKKDVSDLFEKVSSEFRDVFEQYALKFGTPRQFNRCVMPNTDVVRESILELIQIIECCEYRYSGKRNKVSVQIVIDSMKKMISQDHIVGLKNNNYLKTMLSNEKKISVNGGRKDEGF